MLTIAIDETGNFEKANEKIKFVGGLAYVGEDVQSVNQRLLNELETVCRKYGLLFPNDLHANRIKPEIRKNFLHDIVAMLKNVGNFRIVGMLKSLNPLSKEMSFSNLTDEDVASNLYENMVTRFLYDILFYNPYYRNEKDVNLKIATRVVEILDDDKERQLKYEQLGYGNKLIHGGKRYFLTSNNTFKSALATKLIELPNEQSLHCKLDVKPIQYEQKSDSDLDGFMLVADHICSYIRLNLDYKSDNLGIRNLVKTLQKNHKLDFLIFIYDDIDELWGQLFKAFSNKKYLETLEGLYAIKTYESPFSSIYLEKLIKEIELNLNEAFDIGRLASYVAELEYLISPSNKEKERDLKKAIYVGQKLWQSIEGESDPEIQRQKYYLADVLMRAYNHIGDVENAEKYYEHCHEYRFFVSPIDYCATGLNVAQKAINEFDFRSAFEEIGQRIDLMKEVKESHMKTASYLGQDAKNVKLPLLGKFYSSLGQYHAFMFEHDQALEYFKLALEEFELSRDQSFTTSFILHLAVAMNNESLFLEYAPNMFNGKKTVEQFWSYVKEQKNKFPLFAFIKGAYQFKWTLSDKLYAEMKKLVLDSTSLDYPMVLIYKYMAMFEHDREQQDSVDELLHRIQKSREGGTESDQVLSLSAEAMLLRYCKPTLEEQYKRLVNMLYRVTQKNPSMKLYFADLLDQPDVSKKFTFTFA